jgi:predicted oxidoreductase
VTLKTLEIITEKSEAYQEFIESKKIVSKNFISFTKNHQKK